MQNLKNPKTVTTLERQKETGSIRPASGERIMGLRRDRSRGAWGNREMNGK